MTRGRAKLNLGAEGQQLFFLQNACTTASPSLHYKHVEDMTWAIGGLIDSVVSLDYMSQTS